MEITPEERAVVEAAVRYCSDVHAPLAPLTKAVVALTEARARLSRRIAIGAGSVEEALESRGASL